MLSVLLVFIFLALLISDSSARSIRQTKGLMYARLGSGLLYGAKDRQGAYEEVKRNKSNKMVVSGHI